LTFGRYQSGASADEDSELRRPVGFFRVQQFVTCLPGKKAKTPLAKDTFAVYPSITSGNRGARRSGAAFGRAKFWKLQA
jgi:hypothetical protein